VTAPARWYTLEEAAWELKRAPGSIRNALRRHDLPRRLIVGPGRHKRIVTAISDHTLERLRQLLWVPRSKKKQART
jgi:hypothetical protein